MESSSRPFHFTVSLHSPYGEPVIRAVQKNTSGLLETHQSHKPSMKCDFPRIKFSIIYLRIYISINQSQKR